MRIRIRNYNIKDEETQAKGLRSQMINNRRQIALGTCDSGCPVAKVYCLITSWTQIKKNSHQIHYLVGQDLCNQFPILFLHE